LTISPAAKATLPTIEQCSGSAAKKGIAMSIQGRGDQTGIRPLRLGMVGGGRGAFIGAVHRAAIRMDGRFNLVAGALSADPANALQSALDLGIDRERSYTDYVEMAQAESRLADGVEVVSIVTPNHLHFPVAKAFLDAGIHVICDKPMTLTVEQAEELSQIVAASGLVFVLTQNNTAYPLVRQARAMIQEGALGTIRIVQLTYAQDWLTSVIEKDGQKQATWRMDPKYAGIGGAIADIGVHAFNLAEFVTGLQLDSVCADLQQFGQGRTLDDNAHVMMRYKGGARGLLWASQTAPGHDNGLSIGIYGDKGGLEWRGEACDYLRYTPLGQPSQIISRGGAGANAAAARHTRMPPGHPEGYIEAFANLYSEAADLIMSAASTGDSMSATLPGVASGLSGMYFIDACVRSSQAGGQWTKVSAVEKEVGHADR
jgi:predicted dehydrogenase